MSRLLSPIALLSGVLVAGVAFAHAGSVFQCYSDRVAASLAPEAVCSSQVRAHVARPRLDKHASAFPIYAREVGGQRVYGFDELPGSERVYVEAVTPSPPDAAVTEAVLAKLGEPRVDVHAPIFKKAALDNVVDEALLRAIAHVESNYKPRARSRVGAKGIMQLMPATARQFKVRNPYSAEQSIGGGARYLSRLMRRYDGDRRLVAAAYNAGPGNVTRYDGIPPFEETKAYVQKVEVMYAQYREALAGNQTTRG